MKQKRLMKEFEEEAVRLLRTSGRTKWRIGEDLGVSLSTLTRWLSPTGAQLLFEIFSQRYEGGSTIVTSHLPFDEWTGVFASGRHLVAGIGCRGVLR
jgi:hypothetical protein